MDFSAIKLVNFDVDGGLSNDTITTSMLSGAGIDTFIINTTAQQVSILDFNDSDNDFINLQNLGFTLAQVQASASQVGADVVIDLVGSVTPEIVLIGTNLGSLDFSGSNDFIF